MNDGRREVSAQVYREIIDEGLVGKLQEDVLASIFSAPEPRTANEIGMDIAVGQRTTFAPRILELERMGVVEKAGKRPCRVTGRTGYTYRFTGRRPVRQEAVQTMPCPCCGGSGRIEIEPQQKEQLPFEQAVA